MDICFSIWITTDCITCVCNDNKESVPNGYGNLTHLIEINRCSMGAKNNWVPVFSRPELLRLVHDEHPRPFRYEETSEIRKGT